MSSQMITSDDQYGMVISQSSEAVISHSGDAESEEFSELPLMVVTKSVVAREMAYRRSIEQLKEEKRLRALIADYDFDAL